MRKYVQCKICGPAKAVKKDLAALALCDDKNRCLLIPVQPHQVENFVAIFCENAVFSPPLLVDFVAEKFQILSKLPGQLVQELQIFKKDEEVRAEIIFENTSRREVRVEDGLAIAGRNNWKIMVEESLLLDRAENVLPHKDAVLVSAMLKRVEESADDFSLINIGWGVLKN